MLLGQWLRPIPLFQPTPPRGIQGLPRDLTAQVEGGEGQAGPWVPPGPAPEHWVLAVWGSPRVPAAWLLQEWKEGASVGPPLGLGLWGQQSFRASLPVCSGGPGGGSGKMPQAPVTSGGPFSVVPGLPGAGGLGVWGLARLRLPRSVPVSPQPPPGCAGSQGAGTTDRHRPQCLEVCPSPPCARGGSCVGSGHSPGSLCPVPRCQRVQPAERGLRPDLLQQAGQLLLRLLRRLRARPGRQDLPR